MEENRKYKAKFHYQQAEVAQKYGEERFISWHGRLAHKAEERAMQYALNKYFNPGNTVLDLPCGTGRLLHTYIEGGYKVMGGDISGNMLKVSRERFNHNPNFQFNIMNAEILPFADNTFDNLVSFRFLVHLPAEIRRKVLIEMLRVTKKYLVLNYYFDHNTPLMIINKLFRPNAYPKFRIKKDSINNEIKGLNVEICEVVKLSWYERNSSLVIMRRI